MAAKINNPAVISFDKGIRDVDALPVDNIDAKVIYRITADKTLWRYENETWYEQVSFFDVPEAPTEGIKDNVWHGVTLDNTIEYYVFNGNKKTKYIDIDVFNAELEATNQANATALAAKNNEIATTQSNNAAELAAKDAEKEAALAEIETEITTTQSNNAAELAAKETEKTEALATIETEKQESLQAIRLTYDAYSTELISGSGTDELVIPDGTTSIADYTFYGRQYAKIVVPESVTTIGSYAFANCTACLMFDFSALKAIPTLKDGSAFEGIATNAQVVVADDLYDSWITTRHWTQYSANIIKASEVTTA